LEGGGGKGRGEREEIVEDMMVFCVSRWRDLSLRREKKGKGGGKKKRGKGGKVSLLLHQRDKGERGKHATGQTMAASGFPPLRRCVIDPRKGKKEEKKKKGGKREKGYFPLQKPRIFNFNTLLRLTPITVHSVKNSEGGEEGEGREKKKREKGGREGGGGGFFLV